MEGIAANRGDVAVIHFAEVAFVVAFHPAGEGQLWGSVRPLEVGPDASGTRFEVEFGIVVGPVVKRGVVQEQAGNGMSSPLGLLSSYTTVDFKNP